jgi:hypothetical protein
MEGPFISHMSAVPYLSHYDTIKKTTIFLFAFWLQSVLK